MSFREKFNGPSRSGDGKELFYGIKEVQERSSQSSLVVLVQLKNCLNKSANLQPPRFWPHTCKLCDTWINKHFSIVSAHPKIAFVSSIVPQILRYRQRCIDEEGWLHASVEDFNEAKTIFMRRKANHRTHLTNAQTEIVKSIIALQKEPDGATQSRIAEDLGISINAVSKSLMAIEANTRFIVHEPGAHNEKFYRCTVSGLEVIYGEGDIVSLPEDYKDPINPNQPPFNHDSTNHSTIKTTINNNKHTNNQPISKEDSNGRSCLASNEKNIAIPGKVVDLVDSNRTISIPRLNGRLNEVESTVLRFLQLVPAFVGEDMRTYGPFSPEDVGTVPGLNARGLVEKGVAVQVTPGKVTIYPSKLFGPKGPKSYSEMAAWVPPDNATIESSKIITMCM